MRWERGLISQVEPTAPFRVKVQLPSDGIETGWLPVCHPFTMGPMAWFPLKVGTQVGLVLDEHAEDGMVFGACYSKSDPPPVQDPRQFYLEFEDGGSLAWDPATSAISVAGMGEVAITAAGKIKAHSMDGLDFRGSGPVNLEALDEMTVTASGRLTVEAYDGVVINAYDTCVITAQVSVMVAAPTITLMAATAVNVQAPQLSFIGAMSLTGNLSVLGNISNTGTNPAHHTHPVSGAVAQAVP